MNVHEIVYVQRDWQSVCREGKGKGNRETGAQSETKSEGDSICSVSHEMVLVSLGRAKIYLCQSALHSPCLWHSNTILAKKATSQAPPYSAEQNVLHRWSSCRTTRISPSNLEWEQKKPHIFKCKIYFSSFSVYKLCSLEKNTHTRESIIHEKM